MDQLSQQNFHQFLSQQAKLNGVQYAAGSNSLNFAVDPAVEQKLEKLIQESSQFLSRINMYGVRDIKGEKIKMGAGSSVASRTDTTVNDRATSDPTDTDATMYECAKTNFDTHIKYSLMDLWSSHPKFQKMWRDIIVEQIGRDRMTIGFNGTSRAANTDRAANPLLQDVNIGWLQKMRDHNEGSQVIDGVTIGAANEFKNIDALVFAAINDMLDPWHRTRTDNVVICGRNIVTDKYTGFLNDQENNKASERVATDVLMSTRNLGNTPTIQVPFFPENAIFITSLSNLSLYWQKQSRRRTIVDNAKRDQIEDYQSVNEDYVIEDMGAGTLIENITIAEESAA